LKGGTMEKKIIELLSRKDYTGKTGKELADYFKVEYNTTFIKELVMLEESNQIARSSKDKYFLAGTLLMYQGIVSMNKNGYAFVDIGEEADIYIASKNLNHALDKDKVVVKVKTNKSNGHSKEGVITKIIERGTKQTVGEFIEDDNKSFVVSDDKNLSKIEIINKQSLGAIDGHKVVVEISNYQPLEGKVIRILGHKNDPGMDILSKIASYDVNVEFDEAIYTYLDSIPSSVSKEQINGRFDLRDEQIVTIDGEDAKDLDDAISLKKLDNGNYYLGVHIADVSYYVRENDSLDREAVARGTSIYLVDRVIPMLPHKLSNGICSLHPDVDRLTISCFMEIDNQGNVVTYEIKESVIHSKQRMTYTAVNKILDNDFEEIENYKNFVDLFNLMEELASILENKRQERGSINFDLAEAKVIVDEKGKVEDIVIRERGKGEHIIEEFMLAANETVASCIRWMDLPFIYRIHEKPQVKKLQKFSLMAKLLGFDLKGSLYNVHPSVLSRFIEEVKEDDAYSILGTLLLRCMSKARYSEENLGHFGLASETYTHFTSPIRRYPDLLVHRLLRTYLFDKQINNKTIQHFMEVIPLLAESSSNREIDAVNLERDVEDMKKAEYMGKHIGETFEGIISSVTGFGMFIELENTVEGLVHISELKDDYYNFDEINLRLIGERYRKVYKMSDKVKIKVKSVDTIEGTIDFILVEPKSKSKAENYLQTDHKKATEKNGKKKIVKYQKRSRSKTTKKNNQ